MGYAQSGIKMEQGGAPQQKGEEAGADAQGWVYGAGASGQIKRVRP